MNIRNRFTNNYLRAEDITDPLVLTISDVTEVTIGDDDRVVLDFSDHEKLLPLNKTNALSLADSLGDDTDDWVGKKIEVYRDKVMFQGKRTNAVRVRIPKNSKAKPQSQPQPKAAQ
jgi:hypothetical protein